MIATGTRDRWIASRRQIPVEGTAEAFHKGEWMGSGTGGGDTAPTIFLVEQPPDCTVQPHFHRENQFQIFVDGSGTIGPSPVDAVTVHYAGAYTGYGPIISGREGVKYFTCRSAFETGFIPLSRARAEMPRGPKRHATSSPARLSAAGELAARRDLDREALIPPVNGMGAELLRLPPDASAGVHHLDLSIGLFVFVLMGELLHGPDALSAWESLYLTHGEMSSLQAGPGGAELLVLWMPPKEDVYVSADARRSNASTSSLL